MTTAEIITIGTEILLGEIVDNNTRHIARSLRDMGIDLFRTTTVGDNTDRIAQVIRESFKRSDIVITTGGLGPTVDDPTRDAIALALGVPTEFREDLWKQVVAAVGRYGRKPQENQRRQAFVPKGAIGIENPVGTAPAFIVEHGTSCVVALPGVPREMEHLLHESILPYLQKRYNLRELIKVRVLHCAGLGEGSIDEQIADLEKLSNPTVGLAAHTGFVDIRITAKAATESEANKLIAAVESDVRNRLGVIIFGADDDRLNTVTWAAVQVSKMQLCVLEHGTDGLLSRRLPDALTGAYMGEVLPQVAAEHTLHPGRGEIVLAINVDAAARAADLAIVTDSATKAQHLSYGGSPQSMAEWSVNWALNHLRLMLLQPGSGS